VLRNDHYEPFYTTFFGLDRAFYQGKGILDVGCGPRGSLEWASMAAERVGIDPLAKDYLRMGAATHAMKYVSAPSENMPFEDQRFDVVCSFNSLDHVADEVQTAHEMTRVLKSGGLLLLIVEVNHEPTPAEPVSLGWEAAADLFGDAFDVLDMRRFEIGDHDIYGQLRRDARFSEMDSTHRAGVLVAKLRKREAGTQALA
jgi:ubiquinone/menaquinone biosynthesis C-methylase UbiE